MSATGPYEAERKAMVASQLRTTGVNDPRVLAAMAEVPRERFVPPARASLAYLDRMLPLEGGRALPAPMVLGRLLTAARIAPADRVLVVGAGSGYAAAVAARISNHVVALEEDEAIAALAPPAAGVETVRGSLAQGWAAGAPYDVILFDGAIAHLPAAIIDQLADGGRIAVPILDRGVVRLALGQKAGEAFGLAHFADADAPALPGFAEPLTFSF